MFALVIFGILIAYFALAVYSVRATVRSAIAEGLPKKQRWLRGGLVALVFYLIPFWDLIPTVVAHEYYCATEAKFEVFKTIEQWKAENVDVVASLRYDPQAKFMRSGESERFPLNQRIASERRSADRIFLSVKREAGRVIDIKNDAVLASYSDFRSGYPSLGVGGAGAWKFWLKREGCGDSVNGSGPQYASYESAWAEFGRIK